MAKKNQGGSSASHSDLKGAAMEIKSIMRDIEFLGSTHMTWKERKEMENRKVVSLGGKPVKKQRLPLSVARVTMKKQKEREQKMLHESSILGRFGRTLGSGSKKVAEKRRPEDRVLKSTVGDFKNGVLDVKSLLKPAVSRDGTDARSKGGNKGKKSKGGKRKSGKKGGGRRHK
ncbi:hypothetical protein RJ639_040477 [Escallonia herrerae]|uniref:Uncharacterized protein n=1 Tax=Escallonia herrerae TaxID=1293975 RepID=A0AA89B3E0_9ASTE|nr:hypothetical protein RJ639_040477 [Escallonia herrerae]